MSERETEALLPSMKSAARLLFIQNLDERSFERSALAAIAEVTEQLGHCAYYASEYALVEDEEPEVILIDSSARGIFDRLARLRERETGRDSQVIALLPKQARDEFLQNLCDHGVNDFLRADAPHFEIRSRIESAIALYRSRHENSALREEVTRHLRRDDVTGAMSRRFFFQQAHRECSRARRYNRHLSCLMIEVDHYKTLCATYGEAAGEYVLRVLAFIVGQWTRDCDIIARFSDAKFVVLLPETSLAQACIVSEKLAQALASHRWHYEANEIPVSVSIGEAELRSSFTSQVQQEFISESDEFGDASLSTREALAGLLEDADAALYIASKAARVPEVFVPYTDAPDTSITIQPPHPTTFHQVEYNPLPEPQDLTVKPER